MLPVVLAALAVIVVTAYLVMQGWWLLLGLVVLASAWSAWSAHRAGLPFLPSRDRPGGD